MEGIKILTNQRGYSGIGPPSEISKILMVFHINQDWKFNGRIKIDFIIWRFFSVLSRFHSYILYSQGNSPRRAKAPRRNGKSCSLRTASIAELCYLIGQNINKYFFPKPWLQAFCSNNMKEINNAPSALLSYISTREFLRTREKCGEARDEGECFSHFSSLSLIHIWRCRRS